MSNNKKGTIVEVKKIKGLKKGESNCCHFNSAMYAIENNCNFVCGWLYSNGKYPIPQCCL